MKFHVTKTSDWEEKRKPCDGAVFGEIVQVDERTVQSPEQLKWAPEKWYSHGENHRVEDGHIKRDFRAEGWVIEMNTLEELLEFVRHQHEKVILFGEGTPTLEIYDSYRE